MRAPIDRLRVYGYDRVTLIVRGAGLPPEVTPASLPRERDRHTVVVAADPPVELPALSELLARHLPVRCESIRLVLSDAGQPTVAQVLADQLRLEVLAPAGPVMLLPTGMLFVVNGQWHRFRPGEQAESQGSRHPAPDWQRALPVDWRHRAFDLGVTEVPAGLWLHDADTTMPEIDPAVTALPVDSERVTVVIGQPGRPAMTPESVHALLVSLPRPLRRRLILTPHEAHEGTAHTVAEWLATRTGVTVEVTSGMLPSPAVGEATDEARPQREVWPSFVPRLVYRAGAAPSVLKGRPALPDVQMINGIQRVDEGWVIEAIRCGLWLRQDGTDPEQDLVRRLPVDLRHPMLVLGTAAVTEPAPVLAVLDTLAAELPTDVAPLLRVAVTRVPDEPDASPWAAVAAR